MNKESQQKILQLLANNKKYPILFLEATSTFFKNATIIDSKINSSLLGIIPTEKGLNYPDWLKDLKEKSSSNKIHFLCIDNLDDVDEEEQEKFYGILKYKGINGYKFPDNVQIILTGKNIGKISERIKNLVLIYNWSSLT